MVNAGCAMDQVPKLCSSSMTWSQRPAAVGGPKTCRWLMVSYYHHFQLGCPAVLNWGYFWTRYGEMVQLINELGIIIIHGLGILMNQWTMEGEGVLKKKNPAFRFPSPWNLKTWGLINDDWLMLTELRLWQNSPIHRISRGQTCGTLNHQWLMGVTNIYIII